LTIEIPNPSLVLLIGSSGAGKSTFAGRHFLPSEVVSSDRCRAMICDDESDQSINAEAFGLLHHITRLRLANKRLTVIDATNLEFRARRPLLRQARTFHLPAIAIVFNVPLETCLQHNQARQHRRFSPSVIEQHHSDLSCSLSALYREGYVRIHVINEPGLDSLRVEKLANAIGQRTIEN